MPTVDFRKLYTLLQKAYPNPQCALVHRNPFELLVATILAAQCTDKRVNLITPTLFEHYPTPQHLAAADPAQLQQLIFTTGFYRNKAKNLLGMAALLCRAHAGVVPQDMQALLQLPGVARKTANVVLGVGYQITAGVVVDTHVKRLSQRLGLTQHTEPVKIERALMQYVPRRHWIDFSHRLILHGRAVCLARLPRCSQCTLCKICPAAQPSRQPST